MGSSRLEAKHMLKAGGRAMIAWLCARMANEFGEEINGGSVRLIIATSTVPGNEAFAAAVQGLPVQVFHGSDSHIPLRQLECAQAHGLDRIISLDGDDVLCSFQGARLVHDALPSAGDADIVATAGLPLGMNVSGYPTAYLERSVKAAQGEHFETGWGRVFKAPRTRIIRLGDHAPDGPLRFTLDYEEDATFFRAIVEQLGQRVLGIPDEDLIGFVRSHELYRINMHLQERYFGNFNSERDKEIDG
jgi:spore coat polysaccharide biosynthesis protein SpsF (cytidylyltransferase family)